MPSASTSSGRVGRTEHLLPIATPIGKAYQVPTDFFVNSILPTLPPRLNLDALFNRGKFRRAVTAEGKLWGYRKKSPSGIHSKDINKAFAYLSQGVHSIVKATEDPKAIEHAKKTLTFYNNNEGESDLEQRTADSLPDAFFLLVTSTPSSSVEWTDIAVPGEYKREDNADSVQEVRTLLNIS